MKLQTGLMLAGLVVGTAALVGGACAPKPQFLDPDNDDTPIDEDCRPDDPNVPPHDGKGTECTVELALGECRAGFVSCAGKADTLKEVCVSIINPQPADEIEESKCNQHDDDCDGSSDEGCECLPGNVKDCGIGRGICKTVTLTCPDSGKWPDCPAVQPEPELCNHIDDNCDGVLDDNDPEGGAPCKVTGAQGICADGVMHCVNGNLSCVSSSTGIPETCNEADDDCDGLVDETFLEKGNACDDGNVGACKGLGVYVCNDQHDDVECFITSPGAMPTTEACDGVDNDCDGKVDEAIDTLGMEVPGKACNDCVTLPSIKVHPLTLVNSDPQFASHGPKVTVDVTIWCAANTVNAEACVLMEETESDWSVGYACSKVSAPHSYTVSCNSAAIEGTYTDSGDTTVDIMPGVGVLTGDITLIQSIECIGNTAGNDICGDPDCSQCTVHFNGCIPVQQLP